MYDEVMQLIALAKNDEAYFKRIEELKVKQMELAQVMEIAKTLGEADKHLAMARQKATEIEDAATKNGELIRKEAEVFTAEQKELLFKAKAKKADLDKREVELNKREAELKIKNDELDKAIKEHRELTAMRSEEYDKAQKIKHEFESKLKQMREIANS